MIQFEIKSNDGVLNLIPKELSINKTIGLVRIISDKKDPIDIAVNLNGRLYESKHFYSAYGLPRNIWDITLYTTNGIGGVFINEINEFDFINMPENIKFTAQLFEHRPINKTRTLKN